MWHNVLFVFLAGTLLALIDCMYIITSCIFNLVVLGIFVSFFVLLSLLHCTLSLASQCIVIGPVCGGRRVFVCVFVGLLPR